MRKKLIIAGVVVLAAVGVVLLLLRRETSEEGMMALSGNVELTEANLGFKIAGRVTELIADEGRKVAQGERLAVLDHEELGKVVAQYKASLNEAMARLEDLRRGSRRQEIEEARAAVDAGRAAWKEAGARLDELKAGSRAQEIEQARAAVDAGRAAWKEAGAKLDELKAGSRAQEIEQARAAVGSSESELLKARRDFERSDLLYRNGAIAASQYDAAKSAYETRVEQHRNALERLSLVKEGPRKEEIRAVEQRVENAKAALAGAEERLSLVKEGPRKEEIRAVEQRVENAKAALAGTEERLSLVKEGPRKEEILGQEHRVESARAAMGAAEERLKETVLYAPFAGIILRKNVERGETVGQGVPVFTLGDLENPWVKVYVKEDRLGLVKLGQKARVTVDSRPGKVYEGRVTYISSEAEFTPKNVQTQEERVKLVFGVKVSVKNTDQELKPGMPADVKILVNSDQ